MKRTDLRALMQGPRGGWQKVEKALAELEVVLEERDNLEAKLAGIKALCQRFDTPAVNVGAQGLAKTVLRIVAGERDA